MDRDQIVQKWLDVGVLYIDGMEQSDLNNEVALDYSLDSLRALEAAALDHFVDPAEALYDDEQQFVMGLVAYAGEALQRAAGGHWEWRFASEPVSPAVTDELLVERLARYQWHFDDAAVGGFLVAMADDVLRLEPVSPLHLLLVLLAERGTGEGVISRTWQAWQAAAQRYAAEHPGWQPTKEHSQADGLAPVPAASTALADWLATQADRFPQWAARWPGQWDFSAESLNRLGALVFETTPTKDDLQAPANAEFANVAAWYLGEALRRGYPSDWVELPWLRENGDPPATGFNLQKSDGSDYTGPFNLLRYMLDIRDPGDLRAFYDGWSER